MLLVKRYAGKSNFALYTYNDDMQGEALMTLCAGAFKFDETRSSNPFAYFTQLAKDAFINYIKAEHKLRDIRDAMCREAVGMSPSYHRQLASDQNPRRLDIINLDCRDPAEYLFADHC